MLTPFAAEAAKVQLTANTEVRSIDFKGVRSLPEHRLRGVVETQARVSAFGLRMALAKLPLVSPPPRYPFNPLVLQEDVVRLRNRYAAAGFVGTKVRYDVERVGNQDLFDIHFIIEEGTPLLVTEVTVAPADSAATLPVPAGLERNWEATEEKVRKLAGRRLDAATLLEEQERLRGWWADRGFSRATVRGLVDRDSLRSRARIRFLIAPGGRNRFGSISVRGNQSIAEGAVRRELPFRPGDLYSESALVQGRHNLQQLAIIRAARLEVMPAASNTAGAVDSIDGSSASDLPVVVNVTEAQPRLMSGQLGYVTDAGFSSEASWSHSNFTGGARTLTVAALAQTGLLALADNPDLRYRGTISLQQPHFGFRRLTGIVSPFVEYREDLQDRSLEFGSNFTVVYRPRSFLTGSLDYRIATRKIYEYRLGDLAAGNIDLLTFLALLAQGSLDSLGSRVKSSLVTLSGSANTLDNLTNPRSGVFVRPALQVTVPDSWSNANYWRADCTAHGFVPLTRRCTVATKFSAGRLFPFSKSIPTSSDSATLSVLQLRDASFTAGGSADVRGWDYRMLGPKFPDIRFSQDGDSIITSTSGYVPIGGFSRVAFSVELQMPMPFLGSNLGSHVFLDGGRVWTGDKRFNPGADTFGQQRFFYGTGAGLDLFTPVGAIKLSIGYKLNPSLLDLVDSDALFRALVDETPTDQLEQHNSRRWAFHFSLGSSF